MVITAVRDDGVVTLTIDDGKVNAFGLPFFAELDTALEEAVDAAALVIAGRDGMLSAGLDMKVMGSDDMAAMEDLLVACGETMLRLWLEPRPVVVAATGHAVAGGTILCLAADHAVAADGAYKWGLIETTIGFALPRWIIALARGSVRVDRLDGLLLPGTVVDPKTAVEVGFADELAASGAVRDRAVERARVLARLPGAAYAETKRRLRGASADAVSSSMRADVRALLALR
ncbi:crotonase/enoyl-CoA hydratase family protein [soil metagenome]